MYLGLAMILGGGLVLFGVGAGNGVGGLLNAFTGNGSGNAQSQAISQQEKNALKATQLNPNDAAAWGDAGQRPLDRRRHRQQLQQLDGTFSAGGQAGAGGDHRRLAALRVADQEARSQPGPVLAARAYGNLGNYAAEANAWEIGSRRPIRARPTASSAWPRRPTPPSRPARVTWRSPRPSR